MPDELGVAVMGAGQMGAFHINTWERVEGARLVAVADPDENAARTCIGRRPVEGPADRFLAGHPRPFDWQDSLHGRGVGMADAACFDADANMTG